nr:MAG TPA: hypothetical protein [Caudoviricetes sp.]
MWLRDWAISITVLHCEPPRNIVLSMTIKGSTKKQYRTGSNRVINY